MLCQNKPVQKDSPFPALACTKKEKGPFTARGHNLARNRCKEHLNSPLKNVASAAEARKNEAKKRSLHGVNEHFEPNFDDASGSAVVFQRAVNKPITLKGGREWM
jgi:hypothetical protein